MRYIKKECAEIKAFNIALSRVKKTSWMKPNNTNSVWEKEENQERIRKANELWKTAPNQAFVEFLALAQEDSVWSMGVAGHCLWVGQGTKIDQLQAEIWFLRAHELEYEWATYSISWYYFKAKRYSDAEKLLSRTVEQNCAPALYLMGIIYFDTARKEKSKEMLERAEALGHRPARWYLAYRYMRGSFGVFAIPKCLPLMRKIFTEVEAEVEKDASDKIA